MLFSWVCIYWSAQACLYSNQSVPHSVPVSPSVPEQSFHCQNVLLSNRVIESAFNERNGHWMRILLRNLDKEKVDDLDHQMKLRTPCVVRFFFHIYLLRPVVQQVFSQLEAVCSVLTLWADFWKATCCWIYQGSSYLRMLTTYLPGLFLCQLEAELGSEMRRLFGLRTVAHPSCLWLILPYVPISHFHKNVYHGSTLPILIKERDIGRKSEETTSVPNSPIFYITRGILGPFHTHGPLLRRIMYSSF